MTEDQKKAADRLNEAFSSPLGQKLMENAKVYRTVKSLPKQEKQDSEPQE